MKALCESWIACDSKKGPTASPCVTQLPNEVRSSPLLKFPISKGADPRTEDTFRPSGPKKNPRSFPMGIRRLCGASDSTVYRWHCIGTATFACWLRLTPTTHPNRFESSSSSASSIVVPYVWSFPWQVPFPFTAFQPQGKQPRRTQAKAARPPGRKRPSNMRASCRGSNGRPLPAECR